MTRSSRRCTRIWHYEKDYKSRFSLFKITLAENFQYRAAALSGVVTNLVWGFIEAAAFGVFFIYADNAGYFGGLTLAQTISYLWIREALLVLLSYGIDSELLAKIVSGDVALEMCRPLDLYWHWYSKITAAKVAGFLMPALMLL